MRRELCWRAPGEPSCQCVCCRPSADPGARPRTWGRVGPPTQGQRREMARILDDERRAAGREEQARREARRLEKQAQSEAWQARQRAKLVQR